jgi:hypothetical protein
LGIFATFAPLLVEVSPHIIGGRSAFELVLEGIWASAWVALFVLSAYWVRGRRVARWLIILGTITGAISALTIFPFLLLVGPAALLGGVLVIYHFRLMARVSHVPWAEFGLIVVCVIAIGHLKHETKKYSPDLNGKDVGTINGITLSIPHWDRRQSSVEFCTNCIPKPSTSDPAKSIKEIKKISIVLRLSNFQPIKTDQDEKDWFTASNSMSSPYETWTRVEFDPKGYSADGFAFKSEVDSYERDDVHWGPFIRQPQDEYGLLHSVSVRPVEYAVDEYFYDDNQGSTLIKCKTFHRKGSPFDTFDECDMNFLIPEIKLIATAEITKKSLPRWREIEQQVTGIVHSFVVTESAASVP